MDISKINNIVNLTENKKVEFIKNLINKQDKENKSFSTLPKIMILDGMDGSGKGTYKNLIQNFLTSKGYKVTSVREPSDYLRKEIINSINKLQDPWITTALFILDRKHQFNLLSDKSYNEKNILLFDRSYLSTLVYQSIQGIPLNALIDLHKFIPKASLVLIFTCNPKEALTRILERHKETGKGLVEFEKYEFIVKSKKVFENLPFYIDDTHLIDTSGDKSQIPLIFNKIKKTIEDNFLN